jgi:uncharacterized protein involved in response to NO
MSHADTPAIGPSGYRGPAILGRGLRPFFLLAGIYAIISLLLWLGMLAGHCSLPSAFDPLSWHTHEMLFGFAQAAIAGFALTAVPHWTGRPPLQGRTLGLLAALWLASRLAVALSAEIGASTAAALDLLFPLALLLVVARDVVAARFWRGLLLVLVLSMFLTANALTHLGVVGDLPQASVIGQRFGLAVIVLLISLIGGRVIPNFTGNWLEARGETRPPLAGPVDRLALAATALAMLSWTFQPDGAGTAVLAGSAALAQALRLARWRGHRTLSEPLVWSLHLGYLWLPLGLALVAASATWPDLVPASAGIHALAAGAIAGMILAMTTRATLGHTGRSLHADRWTLAIYLLIFAAAVARVIAVLAPGAYLALLAAAGGLWLAAFAVFLLRYGPMLVMPRVDGRRP